MGQQSPCTQHRWSPYIYKGNRVTMYICKNPGCKKTKRG